MDFPTQLVKLRKLRGYTQQSFADEVQLHVNQIKRYEAASAQPTLETLIRVAQALNVTLDELVFGDAPRSLMDEFKMQFEALERFTEHEKLVAKELLDSLILKHTANRLAAGGKGG